ncbi:hypothetical protein GP2_028_00500 [Gordonia paraffinivorans NBRC 108238]|uniref:Uncharacterized protein n=2 Tax=Gordonia paraffinivorans TaxID=175628 RepID=A0ABQ0IN71_9ACTN|nr:hypothetical protein [Gordonia paraffinivorans]MCD2144794.1 hypothetical protein [Gordonia paraffinivorans]GAC84994.1 hypothetical protein GP2_028_00500 [Gordonia paraffinivorans NBRC 108238]VFA88673.1 Uncharacterised protein [Gordonia paraffinivorans]
MVFVAVAVFVVVLAVALVLLASAAIGAFSAMFGGMKRDLGRRRSGAAVTADERPARLVGAADAAGDLADRLRLARARRWTACQDIQQRLEGSRRPDDDGVGDFGVLALDIWAGRPLDDQQISQSTRRHRPGREERAELENMVRDPVGRIAWTTALVADRVSRNPAWGLEFFDLHSVRVDLAGEVTAIARAATRIRDQLAILGDPPDGPLGTDDEVMATYAEKAGLLSTRLDGLVERLEAFASYEQIVARIQQRQEKQAWLDRVSAIDELEHAIDAERDRAEGDRVRNMADESGILASIYLDEIAPLARSLKRDVIPGS